ncbi:carbamoyl phosphate synthase small subunit [Peptacetobacter sp.]|uniref:carbamoyl phosphate synthase small subunit n=1 Tax=Peptacetobacter sp. TaxID=2991975 RepID=UPI00260A0534|nr:carbamoyl phosphate synthase small subunit [Peptacetobacter sp.]
MKCKLILEDGTVFEGKAFGYEKETVGEVVFNTSMAGYEELLTDPTYRGQFIVMTYPLVGNYGINLEDVESNGVHAKALIVRNKCDSPNNFRCEMDLDTYMKQNKIVGVEGIDTRALTKMITAKGTMKAVIAYENKDEEDLKEKFNSYCNKNAVKDVTCKEVKKIEGTGRRVALLDLGVKNSVVEALKGYACDITIFPATTPAEKILSVNPDVVLLSNGPGNPEDLDYVVEEVKKIVGEKPLTGIGLGHQVIALALGGEIGKLPFGHRGASVPVKNIETGRVLITTQHHGFNIVTMPENTEITYTSLNDGSIEGLKHKELPIMSVQFIPVFTSTDDKECVYGKFLAL